MAEHRRDYPVIGAPEQRVVDLVAKRRWNSQDGWIRPYWKQVEENVRMVAGRHWDIWVPERGRFIDAMKYMDRRERRWRQRPVVNWTGYWYTITLAKATENPPILSFVPATLDRADAILAEVFDPVFKYLWLETGMPEKIEHLMRWVVAAGAGYLKSYWDPDAGEAEEMRGPAPVTLLGPDGAPLLDETGQPVVEVVPNAPWGIVNGEPQPLIEALPNGDYRETGPAATTPAGNPNVDVLGPLEVRSSPEPVPFREKRWHVQKSAMHVDEIYEKWGVTVEPDLDREGSDTLNRLLFGIGNQGAADTTIQRVSGYATQTQGFASVYECWELPRYDVPGMDGGRKIACTASRLLEDGENPVDPQFMPFRRYDFVLVPDRPFGKTPVEDIGPINRMYDRVWGQILEYVNLVANPIWVKDAYSGVGDIENAPGSTVTARFRPGVRQPIYALVPPPLSGDVWRTLQVLRGEMEDIGSLRSGSEGRPPTRDPSGELVKELRYNDDRYMGAMLRRAATTLAEMVEDWQFLLRYGYTEERLIRVSGSENVTRFVMVRPQMFEGRIHVRAVAESMLPEGRGERQERLDRWLQMQAIDLKTYFELFNHPHLGRATRPGGVHRTMQEFENGQMLQGMPVAPLDVHDDAVHIEVLTEFMAGPEFLEQPPEIQDLFNEHLRAHEEMLRLKQVGQLTNEGELQALALQAAPTAPPAPTRGETNAA